MRPILQSLLFTLFLSAMVDPQLPNISLETPAVRPALALCNYLMRRPLGPRSIRRDCRLLDRADLRRIFDAIAAAKADTRLRPNVHDAFSFLHSHPQVNAGAHGGPGFLPWHRVFLFLYEKMLRMYEPGVSLCYWDSTLEPDRPSESSTFTSDLFGSGNGRVRGGPGDGWSTPVGMLERDLGTRGRVMTRMDIERIKAKRTMGEISFPNGEMAANIEEVHNRVHVFVGGHMGQIETAAYDPIFWFHHTFVDCIYEWFRDEQRRRGRVNIQRDWPREWGERAHGPFRAMRLGSLRNIDGQNNFFSRRVFRCEQVPSCGSSRDCGQFMTCSRQGRCVSRTGLSSNNGMFRDMFGMIGNMFGRNGQQNNRGGGFGGPQTFGRNGPPSGFAGAGGLFG